MSWSFSITQVAGNDVEKALGEAQAGGQFGTEVTEQVEQARAAAVAIVTSGAVGDIDECTFNVSLYGHANTSHEPAAGSSNDAVTVSVTQATRSAPEGDG